MPFNPEKDKIAVTVPQFTLKKRAMGGPFEFLTDLIHNEPYLVTLAIDSKGIENKSLDFNFVEYPNTRPGDTVTMLGDGHLVYGPGNPGDFVAVSVLLMESDRDTRALGEAIKEITKSKAAELGMAAIIVANPGSAAIVRILQELADLVGTMLKNDKDDFLFRTSGVFLQGSTVPYCVNREFTRSNEFAEVALKVVPILQANGQGPSPSAIRLD